MKADLVRKFRRALALLAGALLVTVASTIVGLGSTSPGVGAQEQEPTVHLSTDRLQEGQLVSVEIANFPFGNSVIVECSADILVSLDNGPSICGVRETLVLGGLPPPTATFTATGSFLSYDGTRTIDCRTDPAGCVAGVVTVTDVNDPYSLIASAFERITFVPSAAAAPSFALSDGQTISVEASFAAPGDWTVAQCARSFLDDPTPARAAALCGTPTLATVTTSPGSFVADLVVHEPLVPASGTPVACGYGDCIVAVSSATELALTSLRLSFGPAVVEAEPAHDLAEGAVVTVSVVGGPTGPAYAPICVAPAPTAPQEARCGAGTTLDIDGTGSGSGQATATAWPLVGTQDYIDCRAEDCAYAVYANDGGVLRLVGQSEVLGFGPPPALVLEPATGLHENDEMTATATHLMPGAPYIWQRCADLVCQLEAALTADPDGTVRFTVPASPFTQVGDTYGYCLTDCEISVFGFGSILPPVAATYDFAPGAVAASPATGLGDGQTVQISGTDLVRTYDGPVRWIFPTGGWALTECDRAVVDDPTLGGVLTHCSVAPTTRGVTVPATTLETTLDVRSTITKILGGTTDCTTEPGACVVGLVRFEQDASVTIHTQAITFA